MKCPYCGAHESKVVDTRDTEEGIAVRRRRECEACKKRYTTYEKADITTILVIKKDGTREPFEIAKVKKGLVKACEKRPVSFEKIEELVLEIERELYGSSVKEIKSQLIGEMVMEGLKKLDKVAYVRFASVHREFKDIETMEEEIKKLK